MTDIGLEPVIENLIALNYWIVFKLNLIASNHCAFLIFLLLFILKKNVLCVLFYLKKSAFCDELNVLGAGKDKQLQNPTGKHKQPQNLTSKDKQLQNLTGKDKQPCRLVKVEKLHFIFSAQNTI